MTTSAEPATTTIHGLGQSIAALPYQLGYRPAASLVLLCMGSPEPVASGSGRMRGSVTLIARVDVGPSSELSSCVAGLEPALRRGDVASVVAVAFEDGGHDEVGDTIDATSTLCHLVDVAASHSVVVVASARVRNRQFTTVDAFGRMGAWEDLPHDGDVPIIAEYVMAGRSPAGDRASVESVLRPVNEAFAEAVAACMRIDTAVGAREAARIVSTVIHDPQCQPAHLAPREVAGVALALCDVEVRDAVLSRLSAPLAQRGAPGNDAERQVAHELDVCDRVDASACFRLAALASYIPRQDAAPALTLVGYLAWQAGEGALANMAIGAALEATPDYSLARLVDMALSSALRPPSPV